LFRQYGGLAFAIKTYWKDYGGWKDVIQSPILHVSILLSVAAYFSLIILDWRTLTIGMMPTILGFSLAAYAITFSLMGSKMHVALARAQDGSGKPLVISVNATFFHNVFIQALALSFAVLSNGPLISIILRRSLSAGTFVDQLVDIEVAVGSFVGPLLLCYAVLLLFSSGLAMFRLGRLAPASVATPTAVANDADLPTVAPESARELYGIRWTIIRTLAKVLKVDG
jgi:hypothetical protein